MRDRRVATRYAGALLVAAKAAGVHVEVAESYAALLDVVKGNLDLTVFMDSPQVSEQEKKNLLKNVFGGKIEPVLLNFLLLLIDRNRIEYTREIGEEFGNLVEAEQGRIHAEVVTAVRLPDDLADRLQQKLAGLTGKIVVLDQKIDPGVIGGVRVAMGDKVLDGTVRTNLDLMRRKLEKTQVR
jgi:F-type H+-transporting ATPase subunit delta